MQHEQNGKGQIYIEKNLKTCLDSKRAFESEDQLKIISQYLELDQYRSFEFYDISQQLKDNILSNTEGSKEEQKQSLQCQRTMKKCKNTSVFHNFQKHLITTLKANIKFKKITHHQRSQSALASQIWEYFCSSSKISKKFIYCLLVGSTSHSFSSQPEKYNEDYLKMITYFNQYSQQQINAAQQYLCREIVRQSKKLLQSNQIMSRRMNKPQEFKIYFAKFIAQCQCGKISRRFPKRLRLEMEEMQEEQKERTKSQ